MGKRVSLSDPDAGTTGLTRGMGVMAPPPTPNSALDLPTSCGPSSCKLWFGDKMGPGRKGSGATLGLSSHLSPHVLHDFRPSHSPSPGPDYPTHTYPVWLWPGVLRLYTETPFLLLFFLKKNDQTQRLCTLSHVNTTHPDR